jgi:transmembrane 9 superfamily member 2/4
MKMGNDYQFSLMFGGGVLLLSLGSAIVGSLHQRRSYNIGDPVKIKLDSLTSETECSGYTLHMLQDLYCESLCESDLGPASQDKPNKMDLAIREEYNLHWIVDGIPASSRLADERQGKTYYFNGFPMGYLNRTDDQTYIYNHLNLELYYRSQKHDDKYEIVGFVVSPLSTIQDTIASCDGSTVEPVHTQYRMVAATNTHQLASGNVRFTYDVIWKEDKSDLWAIRWSIHQSQATVSARLYTWLQKWMLLILVAVGIVACCCIRRRRKYNQYAKINMEEDEAEGDIQLTDHAEYRDE